MIPIPKSFFWLFVFATVMFGVYTAYLFLMRIKYGREANDENLG